MGLVFLESRNDALNINGPQIGDQTLTTNGSNWLWTVTAIYLLSFLVVGLLSLRPRSGERIFHYLFAIALLVGTITYYAQASGLAYDVIPQANQQSRGFNRQIYWPKYVLWVVAFPVVSLSLGLISGLSWASMIFNVFLSWVWVIAYLVAAYTASNYKWGFFVFGTLAWVLLSASSSFHGHRGASRIGVTGHHAILGGFVHFLWFLYVLGWGLSDGGNRIGVVGSFIWFGILDILLIPVLAFAFLFLSRRWDYGAMNLHFTQYGRVKQGADLPEKAPATGARAGGPVAGGDTAAPAQQTV